MLVVPIMMEFDTAQSRQAAHSVCRRPSFVAMDPVIRCELEFFLSTLFEERLGSPGTRKGGNGGREGSNARLNKPDKTSCP